MSTDDLAFAQPSKKIKPVKGDFFRIAATVLFSARELQKTKNEPVTERDVLFSVFEWKKRRKPPLEFEHVACTIRNLAALGWLKVKASDDLPLPENELISP